MWQPLRKFVNDVTGALDAGLRGNEMLSPAVEAMRGLVADPGWLPEEYAQCSESAYNQYLLYCDPQERFSVVSFVWGPGQRTPVHDHTVWGVIGQLIGSETSISYERDPGGRLVQVGDPHRMRQGEVATVSPDEIDVHLVSNPSATEKAISIHAYGANIGKVKRNTYDINTGKSSVFVSSYTNEISPDIWS